MAISALDSAIFGDMFGTAPMREVFGDDAFLARCIEVEAALARAQGRLGIIPAEAADAITHAANALASGREALDLARLKNRTETVGYPILPLVRQMAELAGESGRYLHWGATTQDIMDTAAVLQIRAGLALIEQDLTAARSHLAELARKYRDTPMAGRTHLQHALPVTFGYKAAVWLYALDRHADRLRELRPRVLLVQFGGAAGTLASLGNGERSLETRAERLLGADATMRGLRTVSADGARTDIGANCAVVLASGGFEGNRELVSAFIGYDLYPISPQQATGDGQIMGMEAGALLGNLLCRVGSSAVRFSVPPQHAKA